MNDVRIAAVFWASFMRSAMRLRKRVIFTRSSWREPPPLIKLITSPLVMRPPRPVPETCAGSTFSSSTTRLAAGLSFDDSSVATCAGGARVASGSGTSSAALSTTSVSGATAPSSMIASSSSLSTVAPSLALISFSVPSTGAGTSSTTLSVSRSTRFSSRRTVSPGCLCQAAITASSTDSGKTGTLTSMLINFS